MSTRRKGGHPTNETKVYQFNLQMAKTLAFLVSKTNVFVIISALETLCVPGLKLLTILQQWYHYL